MKITFEVGDVVCLPSDDNVGMTVVAVRGGVEGEGSAPEEVDVAWMADGPILQRATLPARALRTYEEA